MDVVLRLIFRNEDAVEDRNSTTFCLGKNHTMYSSTHKTSRRIMKKRRNPDSTMKLDTTLTKQVKCLRVCCTSWQVLRHPDRNRAALASREPAPLAKFANKIPLYQWTYLYPDRAFEYPVRIEITRSLCHELSVLRLDSTLCGSTLSI